MAADDASDPSGTLARAHDDRRTARRVRLGEPPGGPDPETAWVDTTPQAMAAEPLAGLPARFAWALDDLRALVSGRPVIAEGCAPSWSSPSPDHPGAWAS
ncbi:hypothetical protein [Actinomadura chokoriensis]|uniref:hypothetical protein n=1 Tax=Actinomadura chokoriensis TaxID=454156 RepID=UPI0031F7F11E